MIDHGFRLAERAEHELRHLIDWEIVAPASMGIVNFRYAPRGSDQTDLYDSNKSISKEAIKANVAAALTTKVTCLTVMWTCAINPELDLEEMSTVVRQLDSIAKRQVRDT